MKSSRLKNFCEVCRKQCKDQNGYHCHMNSVAHQKRLRDLATNPEQHIQKYSKELQTRILQMLKGKYPGQAKNIQDLYQQYSEDKFYVRFNHTRWKNLSQFVEHLHKNGRNLKIVGKVPNCNITHLVSKSGDFIKNKREQELFQKKEKQKQMVAMKLDERVARNKQIEAEIFQQMKRRVLEQQDKMEEFTGDRLLIRFNTQVEAPKRSSLFNVEEAQKQFEEDLHSAPRKMKNVEKLFERLEKQDKQTINRAEEKEKEQGNVQNEQDDFQWIIKGITVKILPHQIPQAFHNKKASILEVKQPYIANIQVGNAFLNIDQSFLQTVIPKIGHSVTILRGQHRGQNGSLLQVDLEHGIGQIQLQQKQLQVPFNQFSKSA